MADIILNNQEDAAITLGTPDTVELRLESVAQPAITLSGGLTGPQGPAGTNGTNGTNGVGVPTGGTTGQVLSKIDATNYNTQWVNPTAGSGTVTNVSSTSGDATISNPTTTPAITIVSAPMLTNSRTIGTITGDATSTGSSFNGSANNTNALTLATVNSNVGSFTNANITVNAKGLITAASNGSAGGSGITRSVSVTSGSYSVGSTANTDYLYIINGAHTGTMAAASTNTNLYTFINQTGASRTVNRAGADTIDGATSLTVGTGETVSLISDGTSNFKVI